MNSLEQQLQAAGCRPQLLAPDAASFDEGRIAENLHAIRAELDAPSEPRLARILRRLGVDDLSIPLITATPALRRSWYAAVGLAVLFALSVASNNAGSGVDRIGVFLTLAPLVPLLGVALAFGKGVDPTHELVVAAPRDTFRVFLTRAITVLVASATILLVSSLLLPEGGLYRVAWLLPALAIATVTMALSSRYEARRVAAGVATGWVVLVILVSGGASVAAMFGLVTQVVSVVVAVSAAAILVARRRAFDAAVPS